MKSIEAIALTVTALALSACGSLGSISNVFNNPLSKPISNATLTGYVDIKKDSDCPTCFFLDEETVEAVGLIAETQPRIRMNVFMVELTNIAKLVADSNADNTVCYRVPMTIQVTNYRRNLGGEGTANFINVLDKAPALTMECSDL